MEFFEATNFGLRSISFKFINTQKKNYNIRLFPMIHIGEERYYKEVEGKLKSCDYILYKGIRFRTRRLKIRNLEIAARKLNLVTQKYFNLKQFGNKLIHADIDEELGKEGWGNLSIYDKLKYKYYFPLAIFIQNRKLTRKKFLKYFMKSNLDLEIIYGPYGDKEGRIKKFTHDLREKKVYEKLEELHKQEFEDKKLIGIVYGAGHMKAISNYIMNELDYKVVSGDFINIFEV